MKQKNIRYILIGAVTMVWGLIIYKIVAGFANDGPVLNASPIQYIPVDPIKTDSFFLYANYPDPFIPDTSATVADPSNTASTKPILTDAIAGPVHVAPVITKLDLSFIKYHGMIYNPSRKIKAALISVGPKEITLKERESAENITLKKIFPDRIQLLYNRKMYTIFKLN